MFFWAEQVAGSPITQFLCTSDHLWDIEDTVARTGVNEARLLHM